MAMDGPWLLRVEQQAKRAGDLMTRHKRQRRQKEGSTAGNERLFHDPRDKTLNYSQLPAVHGNCTHTNEPAAGPRHQSQSTGEMEQKHSTSSLCPQRFGIGNLSEEHDTAQANTNQLTQIPG